MKIERITCRVVDFPLEREFHPAWARGRNQPDLLMVLIEVGTDAGLTGLGAAHAGPEAAVTIERFVAPYFIGEDPMYVERLVPILRDTEILGAPVYCMEMPLWDIVGKAANLPVAKLWGGCSDGNCCPGEATARSGSSPRAPGRSRSCHRSWTWRRRSLRGPIR